MIVRILVDDKDRVDYGLKLRPQICDDDGNVIEELLWAVVYGHGETIDVLLPGVEPPRHIGQAGIAPGDFDVCPICLLPNCRREHRECSPPRPQPTTHGDTP